MLTRVPEESMLGLLLPKLPEHRRLSTFSFPLNAAFNSLNTLLKSLPRTFGRVYLPLHEVTVLTVRAPRERHCNHYNRYIRNHISQVEPFLEFMMAGSVFGIFLALF